MNEILFRHFEEGYTAFNKVSQRNGRFHHYANPVKVNNPRTFTSIVSGKGWNTAYFENLEKLNELGARS